jgi:imidazoleglycerol phosphate synthase glutamine amidotransferase subunit HisH
VLLDDVPPDALFYFVHSYHIVVADPALVVADCEYGERFVAMLQAGNIFATQFHPEKSQRHGLALLRNFLEKT